jgi:hypothetical protein
MSANGDVPTVQAPQEVTINNEPCESMSRDELILANRRMQQENEWIKGELFKLRLEQLRLGASPPPSSSGAPLFDPAAADERAMEVLTYVNQLRVEGATIIRQHEELLDLRQRCTFYATALDETTVHFDALKTLFAALQAKTGEDKVTRDSHHSASREASNVVPQ